MTKQELHSSRVLEIADFMEKGMRTEEAINRFTKLWNVSQRTIERMIALAKDMVRDRVRDADMVLDVLRSEFISEELGNDLLSKMELEANLCRIASGKATYKTIVNTKDGVKTVLQTPSLNMQMKATELIFKLKMWMAKQKPQHGKGGNETVPQFVVKVANEEEKKIIEAI